MSKRTPGLPQRPRGFWPTPREAVVPLLPFLPAGVEYGEPCAGDGQMIRNLTELLPSSVCGWASDLEPQAEGIFKIDALDIKKSDMSQVEMFITNLPFPKTGQKGDPAISLILHLTTIRPLWTVLPFAFAANDYFRRVAPICAEILPIGRVSWLGNGIPGKDDICWARFDASNRHPTILHPRAIK